MIYFTSWWSISETNNQKFSILGRGAHIISNMSLNLFAISYFNPMSTHLPHYIKERVHV